LLLVEADEGEDSWEVFLEEGSDYVLKRGGFVLVVFVSLSSIKPEN